MHAKLVRALGVLDSACDDGIWISDRLVKDLGLQGQISCHLPPLTLRQGSGHPVTSCGSILLDWKRARESKMHHDHFFVAPGWDQIDVVFGKRYLDKNDHLTVNEDSFLTLTAHENMTSGRSIPFVVSIRRKH